METFKHLEEAEVGNAPAQQPMGGKDHTSVPRPLGFSLAWNSKKVAAQSFLCFWLPVGSRVGKVSKVS